MKTVIINAGESDAGKRADVFLSDELNEFSRSFLKKSFDSGNVFINGTGVKAGQKIRPGDELKAVLPDNLIPDIEPEDIPLDILYEDDDIIVVNKPKDMVVHPAAGHYTGTLVNALMYHCRDSLSGINGVLRPGIVHRIDKDTTGSLVICKNDTAHIALASQFAVHSINRKYRAVICGHLPSSELTIDRPIGRSRSDRKKMSTDTAGGKRAVTHVRVIRESADYSYVECTLETGRTHQIRVHLASAGHPVLGDEVYGVRKHKFTSILSGQALHAYLLGFDHPRTGQYMEFTAPLPAYFEQLLILCKLN